ncbi:DNA methyltransferase [Bifidobacterium sp. DSM 109958]|uniref:site-specific DNA-methyltransferase (adenine-specific) n=1 Tax=Bifidobacterium moraviense TaxID=2675323 RepID=A0A7Y0HZ73_9BIFI|nr:DNA methyltransferase [Bifidobacterium sp. DSM 109958]
MAASVLEQAAQRFIDDWAGHGDEKQETQRFWIDLLQRVMGRSDAVKNVLFEYRTVGGGFIDALCPDARLLIEQKGRGVDLDKPEVRQGTPVTPVQQALRYADALPFSLKPAVLCTCNFDTFRFYDLERDPRATGAPADEFRLADLGDHLDTLRRIFSDEHSRLVVQQKLSEHAGVLVADLHNALAKQYADPDNPASHHALATLTVRMVFALYAEDAGLFPADSFSDYVKSYDAAHLRRAVLDLFDVLDTKESERDPYLEDELRRFPYVNGGLFHGRIEVPQFTEEIRRAIIHAGERFTWKDISPVIFGSLMEETLSHDQRRRGGMHYTTVKNIHRVIDPLFLDGLKAELDAIERDPGTGERARDNRLAKYQDKLASLRFLDPACGSGNFLTETFLQLRSLENRVIADRLHGQGVMDFGQDSDAGSLVKVRIDQFHGIEINDFAVSVARTALWIAEQQALDDTEAIAEQALPHLPLHDSGNIVQANALRMNWNDLLSADQCSYIMGNPPFIGHQWRTDVQQSDMDLVFEGYKSYGKLDYVCAWFAKAVDYIGGRGIHCAFVATNSICQGESVTILWQQLAQKNIVIEYARKTFVWDSQTTDEAHVHVVIVGFTSSAHAASSRLLFDSDDQCRKVPYINGYLVDFKDVFIRNRSKSVNKNAPEMTKGSQPTDGGYLVLDEDEKNKLLGKYPDLSRVVRLYVGGREFLHKRNRWCLWFKDAVLADYAYPEIRDRLNAVAEYRAKSPTASVRRDADTPALFTQIRQPDTAYLGVPEVSSSRREYLPVGYMPANVIASNKLRFIPTDSLFIFGLLSSHIHMVWIRTVAGRLKSDFSYSPAVYDSFVFPDSNKEGIIEAAQAVLDARKPYEDKDLGDLYNPDNRFFYPDLMNAHRRLDHAVSRAYGLCADASDDVVLKTLFDLYLKAV